VVKVPGLWLKAGVVKVPDLWLKARGGESTKNYMDLPSNPNLKERAK